MDIIEALQQEESKLQRQLTAVQGAIVALNGGGKTAISQGHTGSPNGASGGEVSFTPSDFNLPQHSPSCGVWAIHTSHLPGGKPRRVNLLQEPGHKRNPGSCAKSTVGEQDVFINSRETRGLRRGATGDR